MEFFIKRGTPIFIISLLVMLFSGCSGGSNNTMNKEGIAPKTEIVKEEKEKRVILALGDSLTAGYNLDISDSFPNQLSGLLEINSYNYKVINAGVSGDTSKNLLDRIGLYDETQADIYILGIGGNDGLRKLSITDLENNVQEIITHLEKVNPNGKIVLAGMQIPLNAGLKYSKNFEQLYMSIKSKNNNIFLFPFLLEGVATKKDLNLADGIHPNREGYAIIAKNIFNYIEENNIILK